MRIGIDGHVLTGKFQGTRSTLCSLLRALAERPSEHEMLLYSEDPVAARAMLDSDRFRYEPLGHVSSIKRLLRVFPKLFRRDGVVLGVFQYMTPLTGRHIVFIHDLLPISHPRYFPWKMRVRTRIFFTLAIRRAAMVVAVSEFTRAEVARLYGLGPDRLKLVRNGPSFPLAVFQRARQPAANPYILAVGRIEARKNVPLLIDAFRQAGVPGVRLVIVGAHDLGFSYRVPDDPSIEVRKGLEDEALIDLYRGASLFVYPSAAEGFGLPLLDALLFGLPVIASNRTAMAEIGSRLADFFDPEAPDARDILAGRIAAHYGEKPVRAPTKAERETLAATFSWRRAADDFLAAVDAAAQS